MRKKKDEHTQTWLFGRPLNKNAREARSEGASTIDNEHAGDPRYYFKRGKWVLKPKYEKER